MTVTQRRFAIPGVGIGLLVVLALFGWLLLPLGERGTPGQHLQAKAQAANADEAAPVPTGAQAPLTNIVRQGFPAAAADSGDLTRSDTAWEVEWDLTHPTNRPVSPPGSVFRIKSARFMWKDRAGKPHWVMVARMLELAEIYVPYDNGWTAFLDIHDMPFHTTAARREFLGPSCVLPGEILPSSNPYWNGTVHKEVHDDGIRWMSAETSWGNQVADRARRGEKMILWSTYYGANYRYMVEYGFSDDGVLTCRMGPSGRNLMRRQADRGDTHLHIGCWRMEMDLGDPETGAGGPRSNEVLLSRRLLNEETERFGSVVKPFNKNSQGQACEGSARWVPEEFTTLRVQSKVRKNSHSRPIAYDLIPHRFGGMTRLQPEGGTFNANMDFINYDFWVTRTESGFTSYVDVPHYASQKRSVEGHPTTIWHCSPVLHLARTEDFGSEDGMSNFSGVALTNWTGFVLKPRDLFDGSPLYQHQVRPRR